MRGVRFLLAALVGVTLLVPGPQAAAQTGTWTALEPLSFEAERTENTAVAAAGRLVTLGGFTRRLGTLLGSSRVDVYDPAAPAGQRWSRLPDLPIPVHHAPVTAIGSNVVVVGGYFGLGFVPLRSTWILDVAAATPVWIPGAPLPEPRGAHAVATDGSRIWVFGGALGFFGLPSSAFVLEGGTWTRIADFPEPRDHLTGGFVDGKVYAAAGRKLSMSTNTGRLDVYDPVTDTWTRGPDMPTARGGVGGAVLGGRLYVLGGEEQGGLTRTEVDAFEAATSRWVAGIAPMPVGRHGLGVAALDGGVHFAAGGPTSGLSYAGDHWRFTP